MSEATRTVGDQVHERQPGPTVVRLLVGAQLRRLREDRGVSPEEAGYEIRGSASKISRMELGKVGFKERDVNDLLTLYGITEPAEREAVLQLARQANVPGWWQRYSDVVPPGFEHCLGLEQAASVIRGYDCMTVPTLLQTEAYARAVIELAEPTATDEEKGRRVELRMERQHILTRRPDPVKFWTVLDEAVLRRPIGRPETMRAQIEHLLAISELPNVTIQVIPFSAGGHAALGGPITILRLPEAALPDVIHLEQHSVSLYPDKPADLFHYTDVLNRLVLAAEPSTETPDLLKDALATL
ncbi:helix-turn-helix domain-containing protein [Spirillospora sp. CA-294931]|uniref:helix-turn-helix domain-containing protein n=1 Tax=Spirillospora sp. CA-294931 TaxID=3240042 RepID=UPI003D8E6931